MDKVFQKFFELPVEFDQADAYVNKASAGAYTNFTDCKLCKELSSDDRLQMVFHICFNVTILSQLTLLSHEMEFIN